MSRILAYLRDARITTVQRVNLVTNPLPASDDGWEVFGGLQPSETFEYVSGPGPQGRTGFVRFTSDGNVVDTAVLRYVRPEGSPADAIAAAGDTIRSSIFMRPSVAISVDVFTAATGEDGSVFSTPVQYDLEPGEWLRAVVATPATGAGDITSVQIDVEFVRAALPAGETIDIAGAVIEVGNTLSVSDMYFDGSTAGASWEGTANASESTLGAWSLA